jgi:hypothetical protein
MPAGSFWEATDKIPVSQTKIAIPATNGLNYSAGQKIDIVIPPTAGLDYFQPKESYLKFDVEISVDPSWVATGLTRLQLDAETGGQCLIRDIRVSSGGAGNVLLEEIQNYNVLTALKYDYESNDNIINKRTTEGVTCHDPTCRSTHGGVAGQGNNLNSNPYWTRPPHTTPQDTLFGNDQLQKVKCLLPLNTGIFQNDKVFPILLTEGLRIEIVLEDAKRVMRQLTQCLVSKARWQNPVFHSTNGSDIAPDSPDAALNEFMVARNQNIGADLALTNFPLAVGEKIGFWNMDTAEEVFCTEATAPHITELSWIAPGEASGGGEDSLNGYVKVSLSGYFTPVTEAEGATPRAISAGKAIIFSRSVLDSGTTGFDPTYEVSNVEMVLGKVDMPDGYTRKLMSNMKEGGVLNYDFLSYTNYKYSQGATDYVANIRLPLQHSRAKSILMIPTDSSIYSASQSISASPTYMDYLGPDVDEDDSNSVRSGLVGIADYLQDYQFFYDGQLNPSRPVDVSKTSNYVSISQQHLIELEKALVMGGIIPFSFKSFRTNFCIGRALSLQSGVYDTRGKDFALQTNYIANPHAGGSKSKLWNCFCAHVRRVAIKGDSIAMEV